MIDPRVLELIRCPVTHEALEIADPSLLARVNERIGQSDLRDSLGRPVTQPLEAALVNEGRSLLYPITDGIPTLIADEAIAIGPHPQAEPGEDAGPKNV